MGAVMRPFRVGDLFEGEHIGQIALVKWVDPQDHFHAIIDIGELNEQSVFAAQFLSNWILLREGHTAA